MDKTQNIRVMQMLVIAAVVFAVLLITALIVNLVKLGGVNARQKALEAELNRLDAQIAENREMLDYRRTDAYVDAYAREYLNMIGRDEEAFVGKK